MLSNQPYKGTRDFFPDDMAVRRYFFGKLRQVVESYGYREYDGPMLEPFELYAAKTGEEIVNQQLYSLTDRGDRKLAVRPEMTPTLARMVSQKMQELPQPIRWYSIPNLWRYERPQRGRLREHWQLNVDVLGGERQFADFEVLQLAVDLMRAFGGEKFVQVKVNHRGLMDHFFQKILQLDSDAALRVTKAIDARGKIGEEKYQAWLDEIGVSQNHKEKLEQFFKSDFKTISTLYDCSAVQDLGKLLERVKKAGLGSQIIFDPTVLRGLDYYTGLVFEIYDISPENRRAMFGGGRYDNLVGMFLKPGAPALSGIGFGMGDVTLQNFLETHNLLPQVSTGLDVFVTLPAEGFFEAAQEMGSQLRGLGFSTATPLKVDGFGNQLKQATKLGARFVILFGDAEWKQGQVLVKNLATHQQEAVAVKSLGSYFEKQRGTK